MQLIIKNFSRTIESVHSRDIEIEAFEKEDTINIIPRKNQIEIMENFYNSKYFQLTQPPGSGKSTIIAYVMSKRLLDDPNLKLVIAVPQTIISKTFGRMIFNHDGKHIEWDCYHDLCKNVTYSKIEYLINFLKNKEFSQNIKTRIAITTHQSFSQAIEKLHNSNNNIFENTMVVIDESHHIMYDENGTSNKIGKFIKHVFNNKLNTGVWIASATPYRNDNNNMIPKEILDQFDKHFLPLDKHWEDNIKHIKSFAFNFVIYKQNQILNEVKEVFKLGHKKSIIFCPYVGHLLNDIDKDIFKRNLINTIKEEWSDCKILDLVEIDGRNKRKEILNDNKDAEDVDIILTCKIFNEGSDWVHAEQCIDLTPSNYLMVMYQRFGRLWRDYINKYIITYYCFLPFEAKFKDEDERRLHLSKSFNALSAALLLQDIVQPIKYPTTLKGSHKEKEYFNPFQKAIQDDAKRTEILEKIIKKLLVMKSISENPSPQDVKQWIKCSLTAENIIDNQDQIIDYIGLIFRRMSKQTHPKKPDWSNVIDIESLIESGFDKIWINDIFENLRVFGTNVCTAETFKEFREIINGKKNNIDYWINYARSIVDPITGELPNKMSLPYALVQMMNKYPKEFSEFECKKILNNCEYWVEYARSIVDPITGKLPNKSSLSYGLRGMMRKYPKEFSEFECKKIINTCEYWVEYARSIVDPITGELPNKSSLPSKLRFMYYEYPGEFSEFKFKKIKKNCEYWVEYARSIVDPITGELPNKIDLPCGLRGMIKKYPGEFSEFKYKIKNCEYWVEYARSIVDPITGELPNKMRLPDSLRQMIRKYPKEFSEFECKKIMGNYDYWVKYARSIIDPITGELPNKMKLPNKLRYMINMYPGEFSEFKFKNGYKYKKKTI
jgi:superfamily II DNA or RNA helicase